MWCEQNPCFLECTNDQRCHSFHPRNCFEVAVAKANKDNYKSAALPIEVAEDLVDYIHTIEKQLSDVLDALIPSVRTNYERKNS